MKDIRLGVSGINLLECQKDSAIVGQVHLDTWITFKDFFCFEIINY